MQIAHEAFQPLLQHMGIDLRGRDIGVAQKRLHHAQIGAIVQEVTGESMAQHVRAQLRRAQACGINIFRLAQIILWFAGSLTIEKVHPLQGGLVRLKSRHERRPELPTEPVWSFYPSLVWEMLVKHARVAKAGWGIYRIYRKVAAEKHLPYSDQAMMPVSEDDTSTLELFTHNQSARDAVDHAKKIKTLTGTVSESAA